MERGASGLVVALALASGVALGYGLGRTQPRGSAAASPATREVPTILDGELPRSPTSRAATSRNDGGASARASTSVVDRAHPRASDRTEHGDDPSAGSAAPTSEEVLEIERLRSELAELRAERLELLGSPIEAPPGTPERFAGAAMGAAIKDAIGSEGIPGDVEATDCSEHPCIVFGRLDGDEEDMEEIERSPSLAPYADDVLTLLFWATTVEDGVDARHPETGLFALAFYAAEEREARGDQLDRRIRARVMEYWNTDRPGARH